MNVGDMQPSPKLPPRAGAARDRDGEHARGGPRGRLLRQDAGPRGGRRRPRRAVEFTEAELIPESAPALRLVTAGERSADRRRAELQMQVGAADRVRG